MPDTQIRLATSADTPAIHELLHESFIEYRTLYTAEAFAATTPASAQLDERMSEGPIWVAIRDGVLVGTVSVVERGDSLYIRGMAVLPQARGHSVGLALLQHVEAFAFAHGFKRLFLSTTPFLSRAIRLYEHFGFARTDEGPQDLFGTPLFTMEKMLTAATAS
jgi:N-acetylglutamate synthase-like GNAT family acetyltransferase